MKWSSGLKALGLLVVGAMVGYGGAQFGGAGGSQGVRAVPIAQGENSNVPNQRLFVLNGDADLQAYYQRQLGQPGAAAPSRIDWVFDRVVAVHLGTRPTTGYKLTVQRVFQNNGQTVIQAIETTPPPGGFVGQQRTSPWVLLRVDANASNFVLSVQRRSAPAINPPSPGGRCTCGCPYCCGNDSWGWGQRGGGG